MAEFIDVDMAERREMWICAVRCNTLRRNNGIHLEHSGSYSMERLASDRCLGKLFEIWTRHPVRDECCNQQQNGHSKEQDAAHWRL